MNKISAVIVLKNNPRYALEAIASIDSIADEIIIGEIDIAKSLRMALAKNKKVRFVPLEPTVAFADQVKERLKAQAKFDYVLYHDPDEIFPEQAVAYLRKHLEKYDYFSFPRKNIIFGKWISHSRWWPDFQIRLFKKNSVSWPTTLHPIPVATGKEFRFEEKAEFAITHYNYDSLDHFLEKMLRYSKAEAEEYFESKKELSLTETIKKSLSEFISRFFAFEGYKDGMHGFTLAVLQMFYYFLVYFYYWELKKYPTEKEEVLISDSRFFFLSGLRETNHWLLKKGKAGFSKVFIKIQNKLLSK